MPFTMYFMQNQVYRFIYLCCPSRRNWKESTKNEKIAQCLLDAPQKVDHNPIVSMAFRIATIQAISSLCIRPKCFLLPASHNPVTISFRRKTFSFDMNPPEIMDCLKEDNFWIDCAHAYTHTHMLAVCIYMCMCVCLVYVQIILKMIFIISCYAKCKRQNSLKLSLCHLSSVILCIISFVSVFVFFTYISLIYLLMRLLLLANLQFRERGREKIKETDVCSQVFALAVAMQTTSGRYR